MDRQSVMKHDFSRIPKANIPRARFTRTMKHLTTFDADYIIPFYVDEVLPGDTFKMKANLFARLNTPLYPIMDVAYMNVFFFFVPNRLLWDNWEKFCGAQDDPGDTTAFTVPQVPCNSIGIQTLYEYMGVPYNIPNLTVNNLHGRAYNLIYNEWFRDENLIDSVVVDTDNGPDTFSDYVLLKRGKRHDYFTSCLPWPVKDPDSIISLPLGTSAPIDYITGLATSGRVRLNATDALAGAVSLDSSAAGSFVAGGAGAYYDPNGTLETDLSSAVAPTINDLREAFQLQRMLERDARGGTRYTEIIRSHFGVISPDARLQRPEYLGGGSAPVRITPVAQTGESGTTPQGNLAGFGIMSLNGAGFVKSFTEHGVLLGLVNCFADLTYQQGLHRMWSRQTRFDFYWPSLCSIGEQEVLNEELYAQDGTQDTGATGTYDNKRTFGYQERYGEYRYLVSLITGKFRSTYATSLDAWHLSQEFSALPTLSQTFIESDTPFDRVIATPSEPHFIFDSFITVDTIRPMPLYSVPGMIDHF